MKILVLITIKFLLISALFIISNGNLHIRDAEERGIFFDAYSSWAKGVFSQGAEIVGYVVNSQWLPDEDLGWIDSDVVQGDEA